MNICKRTSINHKDSWMIVKLLDKTHDKKLYYGCKMEVLKSVNSPWSVGEICDLSLDDDDLLTMNTDEVMLELL